MSALDNIWNSLTGSGLTDAQKEANSFNASEAEKARQFSHDEAQLQRQETERMYQEYESPAAMVRQYNEAGLNPALMYGSGSGSSGVGSLASASGSASASSASPDSVTLLPLLLQIAQSASGIRSQVLETQADVNLKNAQAQHHKASTGLEEEKTEATRIANKYADALYSKDLEKADAVIGDLKASISLKSTQEALNQQSISESSAREALDWYQLLWNECTHNQRSALLDSQRSVMESQRRLNDASARLNDVNARLSEEEIQKVRREVGLLQKELDYETLTFTNRVSHYAYTVSEARSNSELAEFQNKHKGGQYAREWIDTSAKTVGAVAGCVFTGANIARSAASAASSGLSYPSALNGYR